MAEPTTFRQRLKRRLFSDLKSLGPDLVRVWMVILDASHGSMLRVLAGAGASRRTTRVNFPPEVRRRIGRAQGNRCMYCGVTLYKSTLRVDHKYPVEHGGSNEEFNLQALCTSCNSRKWVQTDEEFRWRYRGMLVNVPVGIPPPGRIPQRRFNAITRQTRQAQTTVARRRAVYRTPAERIFMGSAIFGGIVAGVWLVVMLLLFGKYSAGTGVAVLGGFALFAFVFVTSLWRAYYTGATQERPEESDG